MTANIIATPAHRAVGTEVQDLLEAASQQLLWTLAHHLDHTREAQEDVQEILAKAGVETDEDQMLSIMSGLAAWIETFEPRERS